jgi:hypothetical protein
MRIIGNAGKAREVQAVASGALSTGDAVVVNSDGTVSAAALENVTQANGSRTAFNATRTNWTSSAFDSLNNKVVIAYRNQDDSEHGYAVVGTVSDTSISFGTPVKFNAGNSEYISIVYDANAQKVVICYTDASNSDYGTAIVGTVSGTSISFGTEVVFVSSTARFVSAVYDSNSNKVVIAYVNSSYWGKAIVGTVSGTSISFGAENGYQSSRVDHPTVGFDSTNNKAVIMFSDDGNGNYLTGIVATVSGTGISFGSKVSSGFATYENNSSIDIAFDSANGKIVVVTQSDASPNKPTALVATVSGTSLSFGSPVTINTNLTTGQMRVVYDSVAGKINVFYADRTSDDDLVYNVGTVSGTGISFGSKITLIAATTAFDRPYDYPAVTYDSNQQRVIYSYMIGYSINTNRIGESIVIRNAASIPNLTSENYIGTAASGAPSGQGSKINIKGAVDESQSGLTAGQSYYVQTDGTLSTTAGDPSVFAGTAVAATKLIVKG